MTKPIPKWLPLDIQKWLVSLPEPHRSREIETAQRNWERICRHVTK
jgi:hypothetical protein